MFHRHERQRPPPLVLRLTNREHPEQRPEDGGRVGPERAATSPPGQVPGRAEQRRAALAQGADADVAEGVAPDREQAGAAALPVGVAAAIPEGYCQVKSGRLAGG